MKLILYTGPNCCLCDLAAAVLDEFNKDTQSVKQLEYEKVNIRLSTEDYHLYATRIPVVKRADNNNELAWPFDLNDLKVFLQ